MRSGTGNSPLTNAAAATSNALARCTSGLLRVNRAMAMPSAVSRTTEVHHRPSTLAIPSAENVCPLEIANMGAEDFGNYMQHVPGCYVRFGSRVAGKEGYPAHSSRFDVDEDVLRIGAAYYHAVARHAGTLAAPRAGVA